MFLFLDELELSFTNSKAYKRDAKLIRDLIIVVDKFNKLCRKLRYDVFALCSVRSEVLNAVGSTGKEINKVIEDFGVMVSWHQAGGDLRDHPLIKIILKRLALSEKRHGFRIYPEINLLIDEKGLPTILHDLYYAGVIGNNYSQELDPVDGPVNYQSKRTDKPKRRIRFVFRGDDHLLLDKGMMIHNALLSYLSIAE